MATGRLSLRPRQTEAPLVGCPSRPRGGFVLAVSSISWLPMVVLGLDGFSRLLSLTFPKSVS